jgi:hypothetical protein
MRDIGNVVVLSLLAGGLVVIITIAVAVNPMLGAVLAPLLPGVAAIIRAVSGRGASDGPADDDGPSSMDDLE